MQDLNFSDKSIYPHLRNRLRKQVAERLCKPLAAL